jgi:selenocysteine lyase/cysteine desulfurase
MLDLTALRADTPACAHLIHLNNAGASLPPLPVQRAVLDFLALEAEIGGYEAADLRRSAINGFYTAFAQLLNTAPHNVAFAASATDAYARALSALPWQAGDVLLTTDNDYVSNQIAFLSLQKRLGIKVLRARELPTGGVDVGDLEQLIKKHQPRLVAVTQVPTNSGLVQPIAAIGQICRAAGVWYLVDACQGAGQLPLDVVEIGCDFLTATTRKYLRGPRGAGILYASDRVLEANLELLLPDLRSATWTGADTYQAVPGATRFEYWEMSPALLLGSRAAAEYALAIGLENIAERVSALAVLARQLLSELPGVRVLDDGDELCGIVTATHPAFEGPRIRDWLRTRQINTSVAPHTAAQLDMARKGVDWLLRLSPHYYNTEAEMEQAVAAIGEYLV